ncbi:MAG: O-antigen ligase family protein [Acidobacteriota bacterium]
MTDPVAQPAAPPPATRSDTGFWLYAGHLLSVWGLALSNLFLGLMVIWGVRHRRRLNWDWSRDSVLLVPAGLFVITYVASIATSLMPEVSLDQLRDVLSYTTLALAPVLVRGETRVRRLYDTLIAMVVVLAIHGMGQYYLTDYGTLHRRIVGLFSHYQTFAGVLLLGALLIAARLATGGWRRPSLWVAFGLVLWTLMLSLTRGAWVAAALTLGAYALLRLYRRPAAWGTAAAAVLLVTFVAPDSWGERLRSIQDLRDVSNYDRLCMADAAIYMISERPLFGVGPEVVAERYPIYRHPTAPRVTVPHLHNSLLQRAAEQGLISVLLYLWLMAACWVVTWRAYRREGGAKGPRGELFLATLLILVGFNLAGLFEDNWRDTEVRRLVLFFMAVPLCLARSASPGSPTGSEPRPESKPSSSSASEPHALEPT